VLSTHAELAIKGPPLSDPLEMHYRIRLWHVHSCSPWAREQDQYMCYWLWCTCGCSQL